MLYIENNSVVFQVTEIRIPIPIHHYLFHNPKEHLLRNCLHLKPELIDVYKSFISSYKPCSIVVADTLFATLEIEKSAIWLIQLKLTCNVFRLSKCRISFLRLDEIFLFIIFVYSHPFDKISFDIDKSFESERFVDWFIDEILLSFIINKYLFIWTRLKWFENFAYKSNENVLKKKNNWWDGDWFYFSL